ncbi:MAG: pyrroloquinoline quinone biosynthesis peptide chaperone PqqD, partial [Steroidobacter sp.]
PVLVCPGGDVHLNDGAAAILRLCDGSRNRDAIIAEIVRASPMRTIAADIVEFLNVARSRGWIVEL